ncbi:tyrosine-type recombinase/integrase [Lentzea atacamensis]|uniref:tyrosine-type recombinase/integrase n=1 Tax=Lentzea atacamensis TaxID=531938 RepID=UPI001B8645A8|nr:tyrosine-type recombinase/integrase [Lentzea atacamensis]
MDGVTRPVERSGHSKQSARSNLLDHLKERRRTSSESDISPETKVKDLVALWIKGLEKKVAAGKRSPGTLRTYMVYVDTIVLKQLGELAIREVTVGRVDAVIQGVLQDKGAGAAKSTRAVISGAMALAARHDAVDSNPTRDADTIDAPDKTPARALTLEEVALVRGKVRYHKKSVARDLPDFFDMLLATGVRIGEVCAITWDALDLTNRTVRIEGVVVRVKGEGLIIKAYPGSKLKHRTLVLPRWAVAMLTGRKLTCVDNPWNAVFTSPKGLLRDPSNTNADLREVLDAEVWDDSNETLLYPPMPWVTSHVLGRKTVLTLMDEAGLPARNAADQAGHAKVSMTQDNYFGRKTLDTGAADVLDATIGPLVKPVRPRSCP